MTHSDYGIDICWHTSFRRTQLYTCNKYGRMLMVDYWHRYSQLSKIFSTIQMTF